MSDLLIGFINLFPGAVPGLVDDAIKGMVDTYTDVYYKVLDLGTANDLPAYSTEIAFPWQNAVAAAERVFAVAATAERLGDQYYVSPISLRFTAPSRAFLAMQHATTTCMIEVPGLVGVHGGFESMARYERAMYDLGGRPHWGLQFDHIGGGQGLLAKMYPRLPQWLATRATLDPAGTFDNDFTQRVGLSTPPYTRA